MTREDLDLLIGKYLDGLCTPEEARRLLKEVETSEEARCDLARFLYHEKTLRKELGSLPQALDDSGQFPDVRFGTGIHKFSRDKDGKSVGRKSSGSLRALRRHRFPRLPVWPFALAAGVLVCVTLYVTLYRGGGLTRVAPTSLAEDARVREAFETNRQAQEELSRKAEAERLAQAEVWRKETARDLSLERLAELERRKQELGGAQRQAEALKQADRAAAEARRQELARLETQRQEEETKLAQAEVQARKAEEDRVRAAAERTEAERKLAESRRQAQEIGRVIFVVELKKEAGPAPVLVRGKGAQATRVPLTKDMALLKGDRIETGAQPLAGGAASKPQPLAVHAALELAGGATVDLAEGTSFALIGETTTHLEQGQLYADVSAGAARPAEAGQPPAAPKPVAFKTAYADVLVERASFDLRATAQEAVVRVEEGVAMFKNEHGEREVKRLQTSVARTDYAPAPVVAVAAGALWRGRENRANLGPNSIADPGFEDNGKGWQGEGPGKFAVVNQGAHSGGAAAMLDVNSDALSTTLYQDFEVKENQTFRAGAWVKGENGGVVFLRWADDSFSSAARKTLRDDLVGRASNTREWTHASGEFKAPPKAKVVRFMLRAPLKTKGRVWFDDCELVLRKGE